MSYARISKMLHQTTTDVRHPMYETGDKLHALKDAVRGDPVMRADSALAAKLNQLEQAHDAVMQHLNAHYRWD